MLGGFLSRQPPPKRRGASLAKVGQVCHTENKGPRRKQLVTSAEYEVSEVRGRRKDSRSKRKPVCKSLWAEVLKC